MCDEKKNGTNGTEEKKSDASSGDELAKRVKEEIEAGYFMLMGPGC